MNSAEILDLMKAANERIQATQGRSLTIQQKEILRQALEGKRLKDITVEGYSDLTVQQLYCPELWKLLSEATNQKVSIRTIPLVLKSLLQQPALPVLPVKHSADHPPSLSTPPFSHSPLSSVAPSQTSLAVRHNLPTPTYNQFIGREAEIAKLLELLSPHHGAHLISVDGIGGVGKTSLVVEVAYRCLRASQQADETFQGFPSFEVIIFTSAKQDFLTPFSLLKRVGKPHRTLQDIFRQIARTLGDVELAGQTTEDQVDLLKDALASVRTLLIVDNLETIESPQDVLSFLYCDLPPTVKAVITTRRQGIFVPLRLSALLESEALQLIQQEATEKRVNLSVAESQQLYQRTGGIPVAIHYAIGQMASSYSVQYVLEQLAQANHDVAHFCLENSVALIRNRPAHHLLMALTFFTAPVHRERLLEVALAESGLGANNSSANNLITEAAFAQLQELSLVLQTQDGYSILPLTREYMVAELQNYPEFEQAARNRWVHWCLKVAQTYGRRTHWDWQTQDDVLEAEWFNIQPVLDWCMQQERYDDLCQFWQSFDLHVFLQGSRHDRLKCWGERLEWIDWLIQAAKLRDLPFAVEVMSSRGWISTTLGQPADLSEADRLYLEAWSLGFHAPLQTRLNLAVNLLALRVHQGQLTDAEHWLGTSLKLLEQNALPASERILQLSRIRYYQGKMSFDQGDYATSEGFFREAVKQAQAINWQRVVGRARTWLADIAVKQGDFAAAEQLLREELGVAERNPDRYQLACCQRSLSELAKTQNDQAMAQQWAQAALENFDRLGMRTEAKAMRAFLKGLAEDVKRLT